MTTTMKCLGYYRNECMCCNIKSHFQEIGWWFTQFFKISNQNSSRPPTLAINIFFEFATTTFETNSTPYAGIASNTDVIGWRWAGKNHSVVKYFQQKYFLTSTKLPSKKLPFSATYAAIASIDIFLDFPNK